MEKKKEESLDFELTGNEFFKKYIAESVVETGFLKRLFLNIFGKEIVSYDIDDNGGTFIYCREWNNRLYIMKEERVSKLTTK